MLATMVLALMRFQAISTRKSDGGMFPLKEILEQRRLLDVQMALMSMQAF